MTEERNSRDYSAKREIRKNRREKENHLGEIRKIWETHGEKRKCRSTEDGLEMRGRERVHERCSERESEIAREIWREKMNAGRN